MRIFWVTSVNKMLLNYLDLKLFSYSKAEIELKNYIEFGKEDGYCKILANEV